MSGKGNNGTLSYEDIYGSGSLDTVPGTQEKSNPNSADVTGAMSKDKAGIMNIKGNILGQPLTIWAGLIGLLILVKYLVEKEGA